MPLIARKFKKLKKLLVSATDYNSERFGLLPLVSSLLVWTPLYQSAFPKLDGCLKKLNNGIDVLAEYNNLAILAKTFDWFSDTAAAFTQTSGSWADAIKELSEVKEECQRICTSGSYNKRIEALKILKGKVHFDGSKKHISSVIVSEESNHLSNVMALCVVVFTFGVFLLIPILAAVSGRH